MPTIFSLDTPAQVAKERSTFAVTVAFTDENGDAVVPNAGLTWSLTKADRTTIVNGREEVAIAEASSVTVVLSGADLALEVGVTLDWRYLVIEGTYDSDLGTNLPLKDHVKFPLVDIAKVVTA